MDYILRCLSDRLFILPWWITMTSYDTHYYLGSQQTGLSLKPNMILSLIVSEPQSCEVVNVSYTALSIY